MRCEYITLTAEDSRSLFQLLVTNITFRLFDQLQIQTDEVIMRHIELGFND